jgi:DNA-binding CsgD family transcriptional regulator
LTVAIADEMRKRCSSLDARILRAFGRLHNLKRRAKELGYTSQEIDAYVSNAEEKARMKSRGEAWFEQRGVALGDYEQYCALGAQEVSQGTAIGQLLRQR